MISNKSVAILVAFATQALAFSTHQSQLLRQAPLYANNDFDAVTSRRDALQTSATAAAALVASSLPVNAEDGGKLIEFTVNNLDGKEGETGSFVVKTHPEWAPIGAERFEVRQHVLVEFSPLVSLCLLKLISFVLRHWLPNHSLMDVVFSASCLGLYLNLVSMESKSV